MKLLGLRIYEIVLIVFAILVGFLWPKYFFVTSFVLIWVYMISTKRKRSLKRYGISTVIAFVWVLFAQGLYDYNKNFLTLFGINTFPFFGWAIGLYGIHLIYSYLEHFVKKDSFWFRLAFFSLVFWVLLLISESFAYNFFNVHNVTSTTYSGIKFCNCLHAPFWMKVVYFLLGPIFFIVSKFFRVDKFSK